MTFFISKEVMLIYSLLSSFVILFFLQTSYGADDVASFCFESDVSLRAVKHSIEFILLDQDRVSFREDDHCLDIIASQSRKKILEKFLSKEYSLVAETPPKESRECHLELKTTTKKKQTAQDFKLGVKSNLSVGESSANTVTSAEMLLGAGRAGTLNVGAKTLQVECHPSRSLDGFELNFYFEEKNRAIVSTSVHVNKNEVLNIANVKNTLDEKNKTLGIPQTAMGSTEGTEDISYELKVY
jgi:hypothetical protein